ncbi:UDP-N-acetylmuramoyl-tripeptide--D-alanyl-D-alanine ligase [Aquimarina agarilytica]|uniref:UDP-N-acetylmuramoyl-tripeptide--D-alanyl-D- alanine ligase n=1 Tax=Aquimarina agarilytica TaxID=1087449 RepID=UPI0002885FAD|nr:UDP-N-acetylmuramoyl-tripeptide--D-alanyl-D-alanine ligase [Aquimarina agarilytica]
MEIKKLHQLFLNSSGVCTDTRSLNNNQLFFALKGDSFDGNQYAVKAIEDGACFAIIDDPKIIHSKAILVENVLQTLQELANFHRNYLSIPIIALTGSNGKTTTKELIHAVIKTKFNCTATYGNLNNHIGVPLTLLKMDTSTEIGVVEMGANHLYEIDQLCKVAQPNFGYITNIGKAHLEGFGSEENILLGKTELYRHLDTNKGIIFGNIEDAILTEKSKKSNAIYFSNTSKSDYQIKFIEAQPFVKVLVKETEINSNLIGAYNYTNIAASIAIGLYFGIDITAIKQAIEKYIPANNRSQLIKTKTNQLILDAYNANPSSMTAAIKNFENDHTKKDNKVVILGDMFELGQYSEKEHQSIVSHLENSKINQIFLAGDHFFDCSTNSKKIAFFKSTTSLISHLKTYPISNSAILIKGSRGMKLEQTTEFL